MSLTHSEYLDVLQGAVDQFATVLAEGDLAGEVPGCPGWTLADLTRHLGGVHRWARDIVITGEMGEREAGPTDPAELHPWFVEGAGLLLDTLRSTDPTTPTWTFGPEPRVVGFWARRQALETTVHLWDAHGSQGRAWEIDPVLAADGVDEVVTVFVPRQLRNGRLDPLPGAVRIEIEGGPALTLSTEEDPPEPGATVRGPADRLLLALWRRVPVSGLEVSGDAELAESVFRAPLTS